MKKEEIGVSLQEEYKDYCNKFNNVWKYLQSHSKSVEIITKEICELRLYFDSYEKWKKVFSEVGVAYVSSESCDYGVLKDSSLSDLALFSENGHFLLDERYIIPVRDMLGNIIALIGWYPDNKRYITTPSRFFVKDCLFFGMEQLRKTGVGKNYFLVEGVFDSLSLRSLGYNAVAQMGINTSDVKTKLYGTFRKIVGVPDNDTQGRKVLKGDLWNIPVNGSYLRWTGDFILDDTVVAVKDIDRLCSLFDEDSLHELFDSCLQSHERVIKIEI